MKSFIIEYLSVKGHHLLFYLHFQSIYIYIDFFFQISLLIAD